MADIRWVFVSLSTCGHAQNVYADVRQSTGRWSRKSGVERTPSRIRRAYDETIIGDLRAGLTVKRVTLEDYRANYAKHLMCGCPTVGHEMDEYAAHVAEQEPGN